MALAIIGAFLAWWILRGLYLSWYRRRMERLRRKGIYITNPWGTTHDFDPWDYH